MGKTSSLIFHIIPFNYCRHALANSKSAGASIDYCEKDKKTGERDRAVVKSGVNCEPNMAKEQFSATRQLWKKNNGIQAHVVIQSFPPGEVTPEQANELGRRLAEKVAEGYEVAIYTHVDKDHVHNHLVINSVHPDTGRKFHCHGKEGIKRVRLANDEVCVAQGLSVPNEPAAVRFTHAEQQIVESGRGSWKDEIRQAIDRAATKSDSYDNFKQILGDYGITVKDTGKYISFTHPNTKKIRGYRLGDSYTKEGIQGGISRQIAARSTTRGDENSHGCKPGADSGVASIGSMERIGGGDTKFSQALRELTPAGRRDAEATQRASERAAAEAARQAAEQRSALERQQREANRPIKKRRDHGLER
ncbi:MAG: relaxase/mobilization nuclease domain-containing protein [Defluviitaleaceae bacterium]|nr:relaxase/mobilization nuclease domain-containing protein [Defluviitaleaceae bacterium]